MNENITKLLEQLAQKMGTTTEYLWGVLLRQAPISSTISLIQFLATILFGFALWKIHKRLVKTEKGDRYEENGYEKYEMAAILPMIFGLILFAILFIYHLSAIGDIINGYFNPDYWALKEIISSLKNN